MAKKDVFHTTALVIKKGTEPKEKGIVGPIVGSSSVIDRMGDSIDQNGWDIKNYKKNPVILWGHNVKEEKPPIGKAVKVWVDGAGKKAKLMFNVKFDLRDTFAAEVYRKIEEGFINTVSVGFAPKEAKAIDEAEPFGGKRYLKQELLELSFVPVPANPEAIVALRGMGVEPKEIEELYPQKETKEKKVKKVVKSKVKKIKKKVEEVEEKKVEKKVAKKKKVVKKVKEEKEIKGAISFKDLGIAPESESWDGPGEIAKAEVEDLKKMCTWYDFERENKKGAYKLPHHRQTDKKAVWRGVAAAMAALLGARGGVKLSDGDKKKVYNHLKEHYAQFEKKVPEFKAVEEQVLSGYEEEIHALVLDREEKHVVRLVKKVLQETKETKKTKEDKSDALVNALKILEKATSVLTIKTH